MAYAEGTVVSVEKSRAEIEKLVTKFGASKFGSMLDQQQAVIVFLVKGRTIRFNLPLPDPKDRAFKHTKTGRWIGDAGLEQRVDAECRRRWRALCLVIKAKLEAVSSNITTFEHEFLAHMVASDGLTLGDKIIPQLDVCIAQPSQTFMLLGAGGNA